MSDSSERRLPCLSPTDLHDRRDELPCGLESSRQELLSSKIRKINCDTSLSIPQRIAEIARVQTESNEEFFRAAVTKGEASSASGRSAQRHVPPSDASPGDVCEHENGTLTEPPSKRSAHVGSCGGDCDSAATEGEDRSGRDVVACGHRDAKTRCKSCVEQSQRKEEEAFYAYVASLNGAFPGLNAKPCHHYGRKCWLRAKCCGKYYPCRRCHDELEGHEINRHLTEVVGCSMCGAEDQPAEGGCANCGKHFAKYFCKVCRFYDDDESKPVYHCDACGICRMGKGLGVDNHHCHRCKSCVPIEVAKTHPCMDSSVQSDCPVCRVFMATSTEQVLFMRCGHAMHANCFEKYTEQCYTCPLCFKALTNMEKWYRALDARLSTEVLPAEYANRRTLVLCNDCDVKCVAKFHFTYHKCSKCLGYNTKVLSYMAAPADAGIAESSQTEEADKAILAPETSPTPVSNNSENKQTLVDAVPSSPRTQDGEISPGGTE
jgi:uncharacterized CHY-type Zn-finger protein